MNNEPFYVRKETTVPQTIKIMASEKINELPVVSPDMHVIGVIHILEITKAYLDQQENNGTGQNK
nr:CBS domain-containing protein [uncultured Desulfobacter sp.]